MKKLFVVLAAIVLTGCSTMSAQETQQLAMNYCKPSNYVEGMMAEEARISPQCGLYFGSDLAGALN